MGNITLSFTVQGDSEGYVTFECPYCGSEFKLQAGEVQSDEEPVLELFCPYCGLAKEKSAFWSKDVRDKARALAENYMIEELNKAFGKMARSINRQKSIIKMTYKPLKKVYVKELKNADTYIKMPGRPQGPPPPRKGRPEGSWPRRKPPYKIPWRPPPAVFWNPS